MCELLAISARFPTTIQLSLDELARHGGDTGPHRDGWGVAYLQDGDALVLREPDAASASRLLACAKHTTLRSPTVIAHIRRATQGPRLLRNTQPFARELGGRMHVFAHNGDLDPAVLRSRLSLGRWRPVGDTDSEYAFCAMLELLAPSWQRTQGTAAPELEVRRDVVMRFAAVLRELGPANFIYADGEALFLHGHRRMHGDGRAAHPPGLHVLSRHCASDPLAWHAEGVTVAARAQQDVLLAASVPLTGESGWRALAEGELVVVRNGWIVPRRSIASPQA